MLNVCLIGLSVQYHVGVEATELGTGSFLFYSLIIELFTCL